MHEVDRFVEHLAAGGSPATTIKTYRNRLLSYAGQIDPLTVNERAFVAWFEAYSETRKPATIASVLGTLRSFHRWLEESGRRHDNPTAGVGSPSVEHSAPAPPPVAQIIRMIDELDVVAAAVVSTMFGAALRVTEALSLQLADIDLEARRMIVTGKGGKRLPVPIPTGTVAHLARYLEVRDSNSAWLFPAERVRVSGHLSYHWLVLRLEAKAIELGWDPETWTRTHLFRHACATELMRRDVHLRKLQRLLRHASTKHTERYLHAVIEDLARAIDAHHPLSSSSRATTAGVSTQPWHVRFAWAS